MTPEKAVEWLNAIDVSDPEQAITDANIIVLMAASPEVKAAHGRVMHRQWAERMLAAARLERVR